MLDVSMVINDPLLSDHFDVRRNAESMGTNGRATKTAEYHRDQRGVVTEREPSELRRREDGQVVTHSIEVITQFPLRDASFGFQPDVVLWDGREYLVVQALSYQRIAGHTQAIATSTRATDKPH